MSTAIGESDHIFLIEDCETCANALAVGQPQPVKNQAVALQNAYTGVRERCGGQLCMSAFDL